MNEVSTLKVSIYKEGWFALENDTMPSHLFSQMIDSLTKTFEEIYGKEGAKEQITKIEKDNKEVLFINQKKVPNIIKSLVHNPSMEIQVSLTGRNKNGEEVTRMISKPFDANKCAEVIPFYHNMNKR